MTTEMTFNRTIFYWVAYALLWISRKTHLTYNEINIIAYYFIIPMVWAIMFDCIISTPLVTPLVIGFWLAIAIFFGTNFKQLCDVWFKASQAFILFFGDYVKQSVVICVLIPIVITLILMYYLCI